MRILGQRLWRNTDGAVAPTVALSLFALIAAGGLAFDYAHMASLDTELQDAADQAALAAATQLDQSNGSMERATAAAQSLISNNTLFASDGTSRAVDIAVVVFYPTKADAENDTNGFTDTTKFVTANFVRVAIAARRANFALTPIVGALTSGDINAEAVAGLGSAVCKVPPLMMCNPEETATNTGFDVGNFVGDGIRLVAGGSGGSWAPGNFGYLETNLGPGANVLEYALGANAPPGDCVSLDSVSTKPGVSTSVTDAINTRFDIYENGLVNDCAEGTGNCSPSVNTRKDVVHPDIDALKGGGTLNCGFATGSNPWKLPAVPYLPDPTTRTQTTLPTNMGAPRDICHSVSSDGDCTNGRIGDGNWDRTMYFQVNYPAIGANWKTNPSLNAWASANGVANISKITRYQVYQWEIANNLTGKRLTSTDAKGTNYYAYSGPQCAAGLGASTTQLDRRLTSVAVVNCLAQGVNGNAQNLNVNKWIDIFLVQPSIARARTSASDIYVEVVRETDAGGSGATAAQVVRRDVPYLVK
jgi:Flp pilus assembly protein TadG